MINRFHVLRKSFAAKVITILIVAMVCMAALFDFMLITMQKNTYYSSHKNHGATLTRMLAHTVGLAVFIEDGNEMLVAVEGVMLQEDVVEVVILGKEGQLLLQKTKDPTGKLCITLNSMDLQRDLAILEKSDLLSRETKGNFIYWSQVSMDSSPNPEENWYFEDDESEIKKEIVGYLAVILSKKYFNQGIRNILIQTGVSVLIFLFLGILATFIIIQKVTKPLRGLMQLIRKSTGAAATPDDLALITETYGSMIEDLENSFKTITELKDGLEEKVEQRTGMLAMANKELGRRQKKLETGNANLTEALNQLQEAQEQLLQKEKLAAMGQIVAGVAHEINNSVNFVSGALPSLHRCLSEVRELIAGYESLARAHGTKESDGIFKEVEEIKEEIEFNELFGTIDQLMENMDEGIRRTTAIIKDLKTFSREDDERMSLINLNVMIDSAVQFIDGKMLENIELIRDYGQLPHVTCLPGRVSQVFINIMNNAIQAMDGKGQLTIKTQSEDDHVHVFFSDSGCGIASEDVPKIFDPFFTRKEVGKGTGLGLGISYTIIRQHGGVIKVQSEEGKGTVFEVILPVTPSTV